MQHKQSYNIQA